MSKKYILALLLLTTVIFSLSVCSSLSAQTNAIRENIDEFIEVIHLNDRTIVVKLGADAVTAVATQKGIVVIDAGISNSLTSKYRKLIEKEFKRNDFAYLIITHSHPDHTGGNQVFSDAVIVGYEKCAEEMAGNWKNPEKVKSSLFRIANDYKKSLDTLNAGSAGWKEMRCQEIRYRSAYYDLLNGFRISPPTLNFSDSMTLDMGNVTLNLVYFGKAHAEDDIMIHIPELKVLMVGDLFSAYGRPAIDKNNKTSVARWLAVVKSIEARINSIDTIIGGHGGIMSREDLQAFNQNIRKYADK